ncbi:ankyrin repeat domain-containing protein [Terrarubrum flagellatum]|uniref:ankyrin repeat domain-containing protein n=1 Tax=Terrirubrum flagellatum TaxID=2895980 RepID=UPI0031454F12
MNRRLLLSIIGAIIAVSNDAFASNGRDLRDAAARSDIRALAKVLEISGGRASIDDADARGQTALLIAIERGHDAAAIALIDAGADINAQAANRDTPWLLAGAEGRVAALKRMLEGGKIDYGKRNRYGGNALIPAAHRGHVKAVRLLLEASKIDVDHVNDLGWTALLEAVILGDGGVAHTEIARLLVAHGADVSLGDREGVTPLAHARRRGQSAVVALLEKAGAR